ncbi:MAG TPA: hypothetical protein VNM39_10735 [Verrucomicrobiae bacterium]|nr:hypothetical protein [Verrucomicrobiae bacterium]
MTIKERFERFFAATQGEPPWTIPDLSDEELGWLIVGWEHSEGLIPGVVEITDYDAPVVIPRDTRQRWEILMILADAGESMNDYQRHLDDLILRGKLQLHEDGRMTKL